MIKRKWLNRLRFIAQGALVPNMVPLCIKAHVVKYWKVMLLLLTTSASSISRLSYFFDAFLTSEHLKHPRKIADRHIFHSFLCRVTHFLLIWLPSSSFFLFFPRFFFLRISNKMSRTRQKNTSRKRCANLHQQGTVFKCTCWIVGFLIKIQK